MLRRRLIPFVLLLASLLPTGLDARATEGDPAQARAVVQKLVADLQASLDLPEGEQRLVRMTAAIEGSTNVALLSRLALGRSWRLLDDRQQDEYEDLFRHAILGTLARRLELYTRDIQGSVAERFTISGSKPTGRRDVLVRSQLMQDGGRPLVVDWRLREGAIIDVIVEGVSLLISQRAEFNAVIERSTIDGLMQELRSRVR